jgi:hypothetical protein
MVLGKPDSHLFVCLFFVSHHIPMMEGVPTICNKIVKQTLYIVVAMWWPLMILASTSGRVARRLRKQSRSSS